MQALLTDVVGLGWRAELSADIGANLDGARDIECLEVIAEEFFRAQPAQQDGLAALARLVPLSLHGVSLGMASTLPLKTSIADQFARLYERVQPSFWSEHLSFVRGGGHEIGHLAAPPRTPATVDAALENIRIATRIVGTAPAVENVATLISPPASTLSEVDWLRAIVGECAGGMLLDLHNLYANAWNFGGDATQMLQALPLHRVRQIHLSGGVMIPTPGNSQRLLDDHVHDVPDACYALLEEVAFRVEQPLMVIIERDGRYPPMAALIEQLQEARGALRRGRARRASQMPAQGPDKRTITEDQHVSH
jgi:uncharacterized protein